ncbi:hypothetical protein [Hyphomicrobium sp.]|uniref:hypothetical protein n=1 Tax=Hyphomicrobium sp. TaxID=82 RepID=UPI003F71A2FB
MDTRATHLSDSSEEIALSDLLALGQRYRTILTLVPIAAAVFFVILLSLYLPTHTASLSVDPPPKVLAGLSIGLSDKQSSINVTEGKRLTIRWSGSGASSGEVAVRGVIAKISAIADVVIKNSQELYKKQDGVATQLYAKIVNPLFADTAGAAAAYATLRNMADDNNANAIAVKRWLFQLGEQEVVVKRNLTFLTASAALGILVFLATLLGCRGWDAWHKAGRAKLPAIPESAAS